MTPLYSAPNSSQTIRSNPDEYLYKLPFYLHCPLNRFIQDLNKIKRMLTQV